MIKRAPHQFDHRQEQARPFIDVLSEIQNQQPNEDALPFDLSSCCCSGGDGPKTLIEHAHVETRSLDDLFPGLYFSRLFASSTPFRTALRNAMREDIFDTTPGYHGLSDKARRVLLLPDSSLQGSWQCRADEEGRVGWAHRRRRPEDSDDNDTSDETTLRQEERQQQQQQPAPRMTRLTRVLHEYLGPEAPTGDAFMDTIGSLCGGSSSSSSTTHWMDIVGVMNRRVPHSWHQDTGRSDNHHNNRNGIKTVLFGFPATDHYDGVGVFSHIVKLKHEQWAAAEHPPNQPVLYGGVQLLHNNLSDDCIVRPRFAQGREFIVYRDVDVLHSSPDVTYRTSVMRFM